MTVLSKHSHLLLHRKHSFILPFISQLVCGLFLASQSPTNTRHVSVSAFAAVSAAEPSRFIPAIATTKRNMATMDQDVREFHQYAAAAVDLTHISADENGVLTVIRSSRNWNLDQRQSHLYRFLLKDSEDSTAAVAAMPPTPLDASVKLYLPSPSGKKTIILKTTSADKDDVETTSMEVWEGAALIRRIPFRKETKHGKIIHDPTGFGTPVWSPDERYVFYSAERIPAKTAPFWEKSSKKKRKHDGSGDENDGDQTQVHRGGESVFGLGQREHWGERYSTQEPILDLYIVNIENGHCGKIENVPEAFPGREATSESITLGHAVWHPSGTKVAFTGWDAGLPKRLGVVYCRNRFSEVFEASVVNLLKALEEGEGDPDDETYACLTTDLPYARSPRYVQIENGDAVLVFLGSDREFVSHDASMGLWRTKPEGRIENIVPIIDKPRKHGPRVLDMGFPGLFLGQLPVNCDLGKSNNYLITTTLFGSVQRIIRVDCSNGDVELIDIPQLNEISSQSMSALTPKGDLILSVTSSNDPSSLWIISAKSLQAESTDGRIVPEARKIVSFDPIAASDFEPVSKTTQVPFEMQILSVDPSEIDGASSERIQAILLLPKDLPKGDKVPLVVVPHGGPHSCTTSAFVPGFAHLASKYAVVFPNYRGSIGFGQASMDSLLTRIGHVDVEDVMACTRHVIDKFPVVNGDRVGICGGSHGGFLTAHCTSQYPDFFKAAACRNPVTNIASMVTATDIPDWCLAEAMGECDLSSFRGPTQEQMLKMYEKSPVSRVDKVKAPTLVALGKVDLRVPFSQGLEWYHSLRSKGVPTKLLMYPKDNHALDRDTTEADHWIHIRQWFDEHL